MKTIIRYFSFVMGLMLTLPSLAKEKISVMLDWYVNPDHAAIIVAQQKGFFEKNNLEVEIIEPADPALPPKLAAAGKVDLAVSYQPQLYQQVAEGLPLVRVGSLISNPLNSVVVLKKSNLKSLADLKGKKVGYSVSGFEDGLLDTMLHSIGLSNKDVELVNVNWSLSPSLLTGQVDAVIGAFRNFELNQLALEKQEGVAFFPEQYGVPAYDELILVANKNSVTDKKTSAFLTALEQATSYLQAHPNEAWQAFVSYKPNELNTPLNQLAWKDTLPFLANKPRQLDAKRYQQMAEFMQQKGLIPKVLALKEYAVEIK
ncbi:TPA: ABC transporter substrate-binding protein [Haemophilus influenzae]|uniref:ABC transporter substrate-binding protein n=1 Tax=Haemophilus influenzae TaxID=727 RepID=UPI000A0A6D42|nr:ABC transporter substrate-binding protein [Haemophilus influenzae]MCK8838341.1 ABC transporter substrate-binding protein [Haemophilus influenzae]ORJ43313.1 thiamine biosynthesis protein [Haemophilus influenzae]PRJ48752.1 putative thiamine biosynthesis protein [Haemophilus influenzae]PRK10376.1 putative thiamine biosynthesis protein [Haemophilus influenzae]PRL04626.1 putative thiamine biosynthesis protein [Haemophilus influenzae]